MLHPRPALKTNYMFSDFLFYLCLLAVPLFTASHAVLKHSAGWLLVYVLVAGGMTALILRFFCAHCPHYRREGNKLYCIFFWGLPKFFTARPSALGNLDKLVSAGAMIVLLLFPLRWLLMEPGLLVVYLLSLAGFGAAIYRHECSRCIYFDCPANKVPIDLRTQSD